MATEREVIIVGAGPAGATAAVALSNHGRDVLLLDRNQTSGKVCGEAYAPSGIAALDQLGLSWTRFGTEGVDYILVQGLEIGSPDGKKITKIWNAKNPATHGLIGTRSTIDEVIVNFAKDSGAQVRQGKEGEVKKIELEHNKVSITIATGEQIKAKVLIGADGPSSLAARTVDLAHPKSHIAVALRGYADILPGALVPPYLHLHFLNNLMPGYAWAFPVGDNLVNLGLGLSSKKMTKREMTESLLNYANKWWKTSFRLNPSTLQTWPIPLWINDTYPRYKDRVFIVGDAGGFVDALTGGGISHAILTGKMAAESILLYLEGKTSIEESGYHYDQTWRSKLMPYLKKMNWVQSHIASSPITFGVLFRLVYHFPFLGNKVINTLAGGHT